MTEKVSVVIPSWNGASILPPALEQLARHSGPDTEFLVVDHGRLNRETERLLQSCAADGRFRYLGEDRQLGYAGAVNRGVQEAAHDLVAVICNDVQVQSGWLEELLKVFQAEREKGRSPVVFSLAEKAEIRDPASARMNFWFRAVHPEGAPGTSEFFLPDGSAFLFDRRRFGTPFDEDYFLYQEDVYLGWRAWLEGESVLLVPASRVRNLDGGTTRRTPYRTSFLTERNRWLNYFTFLSLPLLLRAMPVLKLDALIKCMAGRNRLAKLHAWGWILFHPFWIRRKRAAMQCRRVRRDGEILPLLSGTYLDAGGKHPLNRMFRLLGRILRLPLGP